MTMIRAVCGRRPRSLTIPIAEGSSCDPFDAGFRDTGIADAPSEDAEVMPDAFDEGCGCRTTGLPDGVAMLGLVLLVFGLTPRKRR